MTKRDRTILPPRAPMWRIRDLIAHLGGVGGLTEKLMDHGFSPPGADTVQGWSTRNSIPGAWVPAVLGLALQEKIIKNPLEILIEDRPHDFRRHRPRSG